MATATTSDPGSSARELGRRALRGDLPPLYQHPLDHTFRARIAEDLRPGMRILDVGSGATPSIPVAERPPGCTYVGLDISAHELEVAGEGAYDEGVVADVSAAPMPELVGRFDLVVSFQVLEHVRPLERALENMHTYLVPGGRLIAQMSGAFTPFSLAGRVVPHRPKIWFLERFLHRRPEAIFPAHYDRCWASALDRMTSGWATAEVTPIHRGAAYLHFATPLRAAYVAYERVLERRGFDDLAAYFLLDAVA